MAGERNKFERETDRQTDRQTDRYTHRGERDRHTETGGREEGSFIAKTTSNNIYIVLILKVMLIRC